MVLEATVICVDNSEWMRNGDYPPTRMDAQHDAVNLICGAKTQENPENTVGIISLAGKGPDVLVTPTTDLGKILQCLHTIKVQGNADFENGVQIAQLALKHRQNKNQRQRIIVFVGSPLTSDTEKLVKIAKKLKKNNVAVDLVNFGEETENTEKLEAFLNAVNSGDNSHLITVPPGPHNLPDILLTSPLVCGDGEGVTPFAAAAAASAGAAAAAGGYDFGVDPNLDPELALALRISLDEERARQEAEQKRKADAEAASSSGAAAGPPSDASNMEHGFVTPARTTAPASTGPAPIDTPMSDTGDEDALLAQAIAMSMAEAAEAEKAAAAAAQTSADQAMKDAVSEEEEIRLALQMSMQDSNPSAAIPQQSDLSSVLQTLPGLDASDPAVQNLLKALQEKKPEDKQ